MEWGHEMIEEIAMQAVESEGFGKELGESFKGDKEFGKELGEASNKDKDFGKELGEALKGDKEFGKELGEAFRKDSITEGLSHKELNQPTDEDKERMKEETDWSDEIVDKIGSDEEYEIYKDAGLKEEEINGKPCLVKEDIDPNQKDEFGRTNKERMENGLPPIDKNGNSIELHHIGQKPDSPLAELTQEEHRGKNNDGILHDKTKETEIDRTAFNNERTEHWKTRANESNGG